MSILTDIPGIGPATIAAFAEMGIDSPETLARADPARLTQVRGITSARAQAFIEAARALGSGKEAPKTLTAPAPVTDRPAASTAKKTKAKKEPKPKKEKPVKSKSKAKAGKAKAKAEKADLKTKAKAKKTKAKDKSKKKSAKKSN